MLLVAAIVLFSLRSGSLSVALNVGLAAAFGIVGLGFMVGSVAAPAVLRPQRGARGAGALGGARRRRRAPARLGAADPGADPALGRRPGDGRAAGARPGARPAVLALRRPPARDPTTLAGRPARGGGRGRGRARRAGRGGLRRRRARSPSEDRPLVLAAREAMANAAKHSGAGRSTSTPRPRRRGVEVFVRDRGVGFDPGAVAEDRHGVRGSIIGRMERHGGSAAVRSAPGEGTEVRLSLPNRTAKRASTHEPTHRRDRRRPRDVPHRRPRRARHARSRWSPRRPTSTRPWPRSSSTSPRWCCSTCTCPAVAAPR